MKTKSSYFQKRFYNLIIVNIYLYWYIQIDFIITGIFSLKIFLFWNADFFFKFIKSICITMYTDYDK